MTHLAFALFVLVMSSRVAQAEPTAQALYEEGVRAYGAGDFATACPKFKESFEKDRQPAPLFMSAKCEEKVGHIATALLSFEEVLRLGGLEPELQAQAAQAVSSLGPRVPRLGLVRGKAPPTAVAKLDGAVFRIDGRPEPIDPGEHELQVTAPGHEPRATRFSIREAEQKSVEIEVGAAIPGAPKDDGGGPAQEVAPDVTPLWIGGGVAAGVGVIGFVVAGVTGGLILDACDGDLACPVPEDQRPDGLVIGNYVGWGVGIAGVLTGGALMIAAGVRAGSGEAAAATSLRLTAGPGDVGVALRAGF